MENLKYPIGKFIQPAQIEPLQVEKWIEEITVLPKKIREITQNLSVAQLNWVYRPEGWSIKQVVHHLGDSHMNCLIRFKLALTEDFPTIKPYEEQLWAQLADSLDDAILPSLALLESIHYRWVVLLKSLTQEQLKRQFMHPATQRVYELDAAIGMYAWHGNHHLAHIEQALAHKGQF
jgi:DinB superfamily